MYKGSCNRDIVAKVLYIMSEFRTILCVFLVSVAVVSSMNDFYKCQNGVYDTLFHLTEQCRISSYSPHLQELRKYQEEVSGEDVAVMLQRYCEVVNAINVCVREYIDFFPCLSGEMETFQTMIDRSNWYCDGDNAREAVTSIYSTLPMESLDYRTNECLKEASRSAYPCKKRYLNVAKPPKDRRETMKKTLSSFRCTFRKLYPKCGRDRSLLLTTLEYSSLIIPPALGINVSDTLLIVANIKFS